MIPLFSQNLGCGRCSGKGRLEGITSSLSSNHLGDGHSLPFVRSLAYNGRQFFSSIAPDSGSLLNAKELTHLDKE